MPEDGPGALSGRAALLTRPLAESRAEAEALAALGIASEIWPLTRIAPAMTAPAVPPSVDGLAVTSAHGLAAFAALTGRRDLPVLAVGPATAARARALGFRLVLEAGGDVDSLAGLARRAGLRHLFYPRGRDVAADLAGDLRAAGVPTSEAVLYAAEPTGPPPAPVAHALADGRIGALTVWSARGGRLLRDGLARLRVAGAPRVVAISEKAAAGFADGAFGVPEIATRPDGGAMRAALARLLAPAEGGRTRTR